MGSGNEPVGVLAGRNEGREGGLVMEGVLSRSQTLSRSNSLTCASYIVHLLQTPPLPELDSLVQRDAHVIVSQNISTERTSVVKVSILMEASEGVGESSSWSSCCPEGWHALVIQRPAPVLQRLSACVMAACNCHVMCVALMTHAS